MAKFEYLGNGNEALYSPVYLELKEQGQIINTTDEELIKALEKHQSFKKIEGEKKIEEERKTKRKGEK